MLIPKPPPGMPKIEMAQHPSFRRYTLKYRKKRKIVRDLWIVSGLLMVIASIQVMVILALGTTFLAFAILDETP